MSRKILAGNWKMHKTIRETEDFLNLFLPRLENINTDYNLVIFPSFISLKTAVRLAEGTKLKIGAQNMHYEEKGAFTGEVSPLMLKEIGIEFILVGHSERRIYFGEKEEIFALKIKSAMRHGFNVIYCVGENLTEREEGRHKEVVKQQLIRGLDNIKKDDLNLLSIAYEPVWAIGTGKTATPQQAEEMHAFIKGILEEMLGENDIPVLYGGSVKPHNIADLIKEPHIDGALVGGASLSPDNFIEIIENSM